MGGVARPVRGPLKTLHPRIHGGILYRRGTAHEMEGARRESRRSISWRSNLYPFEDAVEGGAVDRDAVIELIDIGGPAMLRSAAKNHRPVVAVCDPHDYARLAESLRGGGGAFE